MAFSNLGFETEDVGNPGFADSWTTAFTATGYSVAAFDVGGTLDYPVERFEGAWLSNEDYIFDFTFPFDVAQVIGAIFDTAGTVPQGFEDFEELWNSNETYIFVWTSGESAQFDTTPETHEDFEEDWSSNESFDFVMGSVTAAQFDTTPEGYEDFEEDWSSNESFDFVMGSISAAAFDSGGTPENFEDFEESKEPFVFTVNVGSDLILKTGHGLSNNQTVTLSNVGGELPGGLNEGYEYFIINSTANNFQLSATQGGSAIGISSVGVGTHTLTPDPTVFWVNFMATI